MCLRRALEKYIAGAKAPACAALDRAGLDNRLTDGGKVVSLTCRPYVIKTDHGTDKIITEIIFGQ
jgi:hypothetical protein